MFFDLDNGGQCPPCALCLVRQCISPACHESTYTINRLVDGVLRCGNFIVKRVSYFKGHKYSGQLLRLTGVGKNIKRKHAPPLQENPTLLYQVCFGGFFWWTFTIVSILCYDALYSSLFFVFLLFVSRFMQINMWSWLMPHIFFIPSKKAHCHSPSGRTVLFTLNFDPSILHFCCLDRWNR